MPFVWVEEWTDEQMWQAVKLAQAQQYFAISVQAAERGLRELSREVFNWAAEAMDGYADRRQKGGTQ